MGGDDKKEEALIPSPIAASGVDPLETLFKRYDHLVYQAAHRVTGSAQDAEDVLQTVFLRLMRSGKYPDPDQASSYFYRAGVNAALDQIRKRKHLRLVPVEDTDQFKDDTDQYEQRERGRQIRDQLRREVANLNETAALMFSLRYFEDLQNEQIAQITGTSKSVVAVTLHRARTKLQKNLRAVLGEAQ